jgi:hypothetical protein
MTELALSDDLTVDVRIRVTAMRQAILVRDQTNTPESVIALAKQIETYLTDGTVPE